MKLTENLKRTILGIVAGVGAVAVVMGYFTPEQADLAKEASVKLLEHIGGLVLAIGAAWGIVTGKKGE